MKEFRLLCWDGYDDPRLLDRFSNRYNCGTCAKTLVSDHQAASSIAQGSRDFDVVNINNPYARRQLYPGGHIRELNQDRYTHQLKPELSWINHLSRWAYSDDDRMIGICQRFGPFNLVVNTRRISATTAAEQGFNIVADAGQSYPYGVLLFPEFNIFHICIGAGIDPFSKLRSEDIDAFEKMTAQWFSQASVVTSDSAELNRALIDGKIDYFLSGGQFTSAAARFAGQNQIQSITPHSGPIDGKGAIVFMEVSSIPTASPNHQLAENFLDFILEPNNVVRIATNPTVCNPVAQMGNAAVFDQLPRDFLNAIQWQHLEEDISYCVPYDIPPDFETLHAILTRVQEATLVPSL